MASASDMKLPDSFPTIPGAVYDEIKLVKLAREIAMGIRPLQKILDDAGIDQLEWAVISNNKAFLNRLQSECLAWEGVSNTPERVKVKSQSIIEEYLPELYARMNDKTEKLSDKIAAAQMVKDLAGMGSKVDMKTGNPGDRVSITINLGADTKLTYERELPAKVIDATPVTAESPEDAGS